MKNIAHMIVKIEDTEEFYRQIIHVLEKNGIIALPTDTIYGFAVDGTAHEAVSRLANIKGRREKPFTLFLPKNKIRQYANIAKRKIIEYFMPGTLTIILMKKIGVSLPGITEKIGIRIPRVDFIIKLLSMYDKPLAVTSANLTGQSPLTDASEISEKFADIELVIDGGRLKSKASTVIDLTTTPPMIKRKGTISILEIEKVYGKRILIDRGLRFNLLFVCSGNTCRSPMAEGMFRTLVSDEYCDVKSAGTLSMGAGPPTPFAQDVVAEYGGSITHHRSQTITAELIDWADLILVMEYKHYDMILGMSANAAVKTFLLKEYKRRPKYNKIFDPVGMAKEYYRKTAEEMFPSLKIVANDIRKRFRST